MSEISKNNIIAFIVLALLAIAIPVSLYLAGQQQIFTPRASASCPVTTEICQGFTTFTTCQDDFGYKSGTERFCKPGSGGGTKFRCFVYGNENNCKSASSGTYNYSCSGCPNLSASGNEDSGDGGNEGDESGGSSDSLTGDIDSIQPNPVKKVNGSWQQVKIDLTANNKD